MGFKLEKKRRGKKPVFSSKKENGWQRMVEWGSGRSGEWEEWGGASHENTLKVRILWKKGNCAYKRNTVSLGKLLIWPFNWTRISNLRLLYLHVYTRIRRVCIGVGAAIGINFLKRLQILLTKGAEFPIKQSGRSVRVLSVNVGRNGKYSTGMPTNNTYVLQIPVRRGIFEKFDFHSRPTYPRLFIISSNVSSSLEDYSNFSFFFFSLF